ncbi:ejaculatory bulb-specific protein 3-like [Vespa mandarinia]|uniref:ejaculatory bulb-specific protein 3-like n=1 Tax=Vespa mandarinia TaxID=7446 RepID=UPI001617AB77|nr:ejaculatory bulb-specific protein 3-like [Vespa mandarinia]
MAHYLWILSIVVLSGMIFSVFADNTDDTKYITKYDNINVDEILNTPRLRNQYIDCYVGRSPCVTPEAKFLKEILPEVLVTKCKKCSDKQRVIFDKVITWFEENDKETWKVILAKSINEHVNVRNRRS